MRSIVLPLFFVACGLDTNLSSTELSDPRAEYLEGEVLVGLEPGLSENEREALYTAFGYEEWEYDPVASASRVGLPEGVSVEEAIENLKNADGIRYVEPDYVWEALGTPNDPYYGRQWNLEQINVEDAWEHTTGEGTMVAVLDTGAWTNGNDGLNEIVKGWNFVSNNDSTRDPHGHGTHVSGTIAQATNNSKGAAGVAPGTTILPVKVLSDSGRGNSWGISRGIRYAADKGADVVNMSLGGWGYSSYYTEAIEYARAKNVVIVAATGNNNYGKLQYPARYEGVISVGATNSVGKRTGYSNYGKGLDISAPGGESSRDRNGDGYRDGIYQEVWRSSSWQIRGWQGTSMASPHVAAAAALVRAVGIEDPDEIEEILEESAWDRGNTGYDTTYGAGILDVGAAVALAVERVKEDDEDDGDDTDLPEEDPDDTDLPEEEEEDIEEEDEEEEPEEPSFTITNVTFGPGGSKDFWIKWNTNEDAVSSVTFDRYGEYPGSRVTMNHSWAFWGCKGCKYTFTVKSTSQDGDVATSGPYTVTSD